jgi:septum formation protein
MPAETCSTIPYGSRRDKEPMPEAKTQLILASASPRRAEILGALGLEFEVVPSDVPEEPRDGEAPAEFVTRLARAKAAEVASRRPVGLVVAADTIVVVDGRSIGKPTDEEDAKFMLRTLSGRWHAVMTGIAVLDAASGSEVTGHEKTLVRFREISAQEIDRYVASGEPMDKAGAYAIQGRAMLFVDEIAGSYHNVVGLPPTLLAKLLKRFDVAI